MPGSVTQFYQVLKDILSHPEWKRDGSRDILKVEFSWSADPSAASIPDTTSIYAIDGYLLQAVTIPGPVAPTSNYDIVIEDQDGCDVMGGELANRSDTLKQQATPAIGGTYGPRLVMGKITLKISNNAVNSATGKVILYVARA